MMIMMMMMIKLPGCVKNAKRLQLETKSTLTNCKLRCIRPVEAIHTVGPKKFNANRDKNSNTNYSFGMGWESRPRLLGAPNDARLQHPLLDALPAGHLLNQGVEKFKKFKSKLESPSHATRRQARRGRACCGRFPPESSRNARCYI